MLKLEVFVKKQDEGKGMNEKKERPIWAWVIIACTVFILIIIGSTIGQWMGFLEIMRLVLWAPLFFAAVSVGIFDSRLMGGVVLIIGYGALLLWLFGMVVSLVKLIRG
ncbi:hypothetical protein AM501_08240 [Aneurinibacillus migulanus]|uniref:hypothetical protein n=1 Tax=Aneurinibacillus migulanus TaxID=47500 RepID=UPI0005BB7B99|nr:hypothetical protein [Aneurinibacillus migulanus]KIV57961.1 hypothetical protein TS64_05185 [Aneurinibacillus migulanus]KPD08759.1 hypothetical protein AM501_08240 [Aneurinibacillus migulanus]MCP1359287.1 hypothetical protein [Aneurinibacillus migulanus]